MEWNGTVSVSLYFTSMFFTIVPASLDKSAALSNDGTGGRRDQAVQSTESSSWQRNSQSGMMADMHFALIERRFLLLLLLLLLFLLR